jgi:hypothetical protein
MLSLSVDDRGFWIWQDRVRLAAEKSLQMAGASALRAMRAEANRAVRERKRIKLAAIGSLISLQYPHGKGPEQVWKMRVKSQLTPVAAYPHRQTRAGVRAEITVGRTTTIRGSFVARMRTGHRGVFLRHGTPRPALSGRYKGKMRQAIREVWTTKLVDVFQDQGFTDRLFARAREEFVSTYQRVLPMNAGALAPGRR